MMGAVTREELAKAIDASTRLTGTFRLRSGATTSHYFDKFQFTSDPALLDAVTDLLVGLIPPGTEVLAGLELGGVPLAAVLALKTGLPAVYVRKAPKPYGTSKIAEGVSVANRTVVVIEDVVTTGGQIVASCLVLRREGGVVRHAVAVIDRGAGGNENLRAADVELSALFTAAELASSADGAS